MDRDRWSVLEPLLDRALDLSAEERESWLHDLRTESPDLADRLAALLSGEALADERGFLIEPVEVSVAGFVIGSYTLDRELGHAGGARSAIARESSSGAIVRR